MNWDKLEWRSIWDQTKRYVWTHISHMCPHSISETRFYLVNLFIYFFKVGVATYFIFILKGKKIRKKTLKSNFIIFGESISLKNPSLGSGIRLLIRKVSLGSSTLLSHIKVSTNYVEGNTTIN